MALHLQLKSSILTFCSFEKCISGNYLGEISRLALQKLIKAGQLFGGKSSKQFDERESFETENVSKVEER